MQDATFLFTDIEGSTRLWEEQPERMRPALARHDALVRELVERHGGQVVKMTGDGVHAVFGDALDAVCASLALQAGMGGIAPDIELRVRCGLHAGPSEGRDGDYFGGVVNRAARVMAAAHGGQCLLSEAVIHRLDGRLPSGASLRDLGSVRLRDLARAERLYQLVHRELRAEFPALRSLEATPNNLPLQLSSFVGREQEVTRLGELSGQQRLVTVVGLGGLGKTRLALHAAAERLEAHRDGAWLVELAPLHDPTWAWQSVASALGVQEEAGWPLEETLARHVKDRAMLLVLDNCEHVLDSVAAIARRLLSASPGLRIIATSREPLRIPGEALLPLGGLAVPGPREALSALAAAPFESVRLFVDRARAARPDFELDDHNAALVAAICHRLDGMPLAIELAAARVRSVPLAQIASRLKDRFRLLTSGDTTASPRQRTLRATIDWSHNLLPEDEQALFRRLAIFAGGWTIEAAESVCASAALQPAAVLDVLGRLVEKSLVVLLRDRYEMLETVREYARDKLEAIGEAAQTSDSHFRHIAAVAEEACGAISQGLGGPWLPRLDAERENVLAAHAWALQSPALGEASLRLVDHLKLYWAHRGLLELGHRMTNEALGHPGASQPSALRATALFNAGQFGYFMGDYGPARKNLQASIGMARTLGETATLVRALQTLGLVGIGQRDFQAARDALREAIALGEASGERRALAGAITALAMLLRVEGDFSASEPLYRQVVKLARDSGDREAESVGLLNLAMLRAEAADFEGAHDAASAALGIAREIGTMQAIHSALEVCAGLAAWRGDGHQAALMFGAAEAFAKRTGLKRDPADEAFLSPRIRLARAELGTAGFDAAAGEGHSLAPEVAAEHARHWLEQARPRQEA